MSMERDTATGVLLPVCTTNWEVSLEGEDVPRLDELVEIVVQRVEGGQELGCFAGRLAGRADLMLSRGQGLMGRCEIKIQLSRSVILSEISVVCSARVLEASGCSPLHSDEYLGSARENLTGRPELVVRLEQPARTTGLVLKLSPGGEDKDLLTLSRIRLILRGAAPTSKSSALDMGEVRECGVSFSNLHL